MVTTTSNMRPMLTPTFKKPSPSNVKKNLATEEAKVKARKQGQMRALERL